MGDMDHEGSYACWGGVCIHSGHMGNLCISSQFFCDSKTAQKNSLFRAAPTAYGGSQARGLIRATAASLHNSHSNAGSEPHLGPTPQLTAPLDP